MSMRAKARRARAMSRWNTSRGSQRTPTNPNYTHTWATFVRASWPGDGPCPENAVLEDLTISWLPVSGQVRVNA